MGFVLGSKLIAPPLLLAPMEDVTNLPFRLIAKRIGNPGLVFTEFVSAMAVHYRAHKTFKKFRVHPEERPLSIQIFGGDAETMANAARLAEEAGADFVDINMGCWVPKVCKTGAGAALLKDPVVAEGIVRSVVRAVSIPVSVKVRAGWDYSLFAAPDLAKRFQDQGIQMLTLHARFAKQGFEGEADWRLIGDLRESVSIPLIGNGDVKTPEDATRMLRETGCDGVMVGRAAISNPGALGRIAAALEGRPVPNEPTIRERVETAMDHIRLMVDYERGELGSLDFDESVMGKVPRSDLDPEHLACRALRGQIPLYIKGFPGASALRGRLSQCSTVMEYEDLLTSLL
ncbi:MAG TPA: tRNA dihydrouridine synthase DusB [Fimbriimonadaceae bacterium]|nr:tRNA dihydrouridine synthase DusB [Fimbriimonadaceae bacterium]